jgi:hypothetical protein
MALHLRRSLPQVWLFLLLGLFVPGMPEAATAQSITSPYQFLDGRHEVGIGLLHVPDARGIMQLGPGGGLQVSGRYAIELGGPFALEAHAFVLPTDRIVRIPTVDGKAIDDVGMTDMTVVGLEGRLRFSLTGPRTWNRLAPFVSLGGGIVGAFDTRLEEELELPDDLRFSFGPSFLGTLGTGTRVVLSDRLSLRLEASTLIWKIGTPQGFLRLEEEVGPQVQQQWPGVGAFGAGLSYRF